MTRRTLQAVCLLLAAILAPAPWAGAQTAGLPKEIVEAQQLSTEQTAQVQKYIADNLPKISSGNKSDLKAGRDALLDPFKDRGISVAFRQEYSGKGLVKDLAQLTAGTDETIAINAIRVAGELATSESADLLETQLNDPRMAIRYSAAAGLCRTFDAVATTSPAMVTSATIQMVTRLGQMLTTERQPEVLDASVRALARATRMDKKELAGVREAALDTLADSASARLKKMGAAVEDDAAAPAMLRALTVIRESLANANEALQPNATGVKKAAELAGHAIEYINRNLKELQKRPAANRATQEAMLREAETILGAAAQRTGGQYTERKLANDFAQGPAGERSFFQKVLEILLWLQGPPFAFPEGTFVKNAGANGAG